MGVFDKILRTGEGRKVKALQSLVPDINALEPEVSGLSDDALRARTAEFTQRVANGEPLDDLLDQRRCGGGQDWQDNGLRMIFLN